LVSEKTHFHKHVVIDVEKKLSKGDIRLSFSLPYGVSMKRGFVIEGSRGVKSKDVGSLHPDTFVGKLKLFFPHFFSSFLIE